MAVRTITTKLALDGEAEYRAKLKNLNADLALHKSELEKIQAEYKDSANSLTALGSKYSVMESQLSTLNAKHKEQEEMLKKAEEAYDKYVKEVAALKEQQEALANSSSASAEEEKKLAEQVAAAEEKMQQAANSVTFYQKELNRTERDQANLGAELERTKTYLDEAQASADGCATSIDQYGKEVKQAAGETEELGDKGTSAIDALAQAIVAAGIADNVKKVTAALQDCVDTFASFEAQMSAVQAISGATGEEMAALTEKAKAMGASTSFTATEAGQALEYMAMAGWKTGDMLDGLEGIMNLAAASGESLASTSDIVTDALTAFGLKASDSGHFADVLAKASSSANTNVGLMGETFRYAAPVAGALGYNIEDTALAIGLMANAGIKGSQAGTALRTTLTNLAKPSNEVAAYMEELGISLLDSEGNMLSLSELMGDLRDRFADLTEAQQAEYAAGIAGKEAMSGLLSIVNAGEEDYQKLAEAISEANGAAYEMSRIRLDNYAGQITLLNSAMDGFKISVGQALAPALGNLAQLGTNAFSWATEFVEEHPELVQAIGGVAAALALLTTGLGTYAAAQAAVAALQGALGAAITASLGPIAAITAAVGALIAVLLSASEKASAVSEENKKLTESIKESKEAYEELTAAMEEGNSGVSSSVEALKALLAEEDKSASTKEQILLLVEKLNEALPGLGLSYDETTDSINMTADALDQFAAKAAEQESHDAQIKRLVELREQYGDLEKQIDDTREKLETAMSTAQWDAFGNAMNDSAREADQLRINLAALTSAQDDCAAEMAELEDATESFSRQAEETVSPTQEMEDRLASLSGQIKGLVDAYQESHDAAMESLNRQMGLFEKMDGTADTSINNLIDTLKGQVVYMDTYAKNIQKAMEMGVDMGLVKKLSDGSKDSAKILDAIVKGGADDIKALNEEFAKVDEGKENFSTTVAEMEKDFNKKMEALARDYNSTFEELDIKDEAYQLGWNNVQGLINGTTSPEQRRKLTNAYLELGYASHAAYQKGSDQHSPSRKFYKAGTYDIQGLINGAESEKEHLKSAYIDLAETATLGVAEGLAKGGDKAAQEADKLASEVYRQNKAWLDKQTKYQKLTLLEQLDVWEAIQSQFVEDSKQYAEAEEQIFDLKSKMQDEYVKKVEEVNKKITSLEKEYQDAVSKRTQEIFNSYKLFDQVAQREDVDGQELTRNLQNQVTRMMDFYHKLEQLSARGVGDDLVEEIRAMGPSAANELDALLRLSDQKLTEYANLYKIKQKMANRQAVEELRPLREETNRQIQESMNEMSDTYAQLAPAVGTAFTDAVAAGIASGSSTMANAADAAAREAVAAAEQAMSGTMKTIGGVTYDLSVDYSALMANARSLEEFESLAAQRNAKILGENLDLVAKGFSDNSQLLAQWQENFARKEEETNRLLASMAESISGQTLELSENDRKMIEEINHSSALMDQTMSRMSQDLRSIMEAEFESVRQQIDQSISRLAENRAFEIQAERDNMAQAVGSAVREALDGTSVVMDKRKVGELVTDWQRNNARSRGD